MAATPYVFEGGTITIYLDGTAIAYGVSDQISITHTTRMLRNKTDGRWPKRKRGTYDATGSTSLLFAILDESSVAVNNLKDVIDDMLAGTEVDITITNDNTGDYEFSGPVQFSGINVNYGLHGENAEGDFSWEAAGEFTFPVIT